MKKTNLKTNLIGVVLFIAAILVSAMLIQIPSENNNSKTKMEVSPSAITFTPAGEKKTLTDEITRKLTEAGLVEIAPVNVSDPN
jgi:hypothetical protein